MPFVPDGMKRIFLAFPLDESVRRHAGTLITRLRPHFENARWVSTDNLHITVHFIGEVRIEKIDEIIATVRPVVRNRDSRSLTVDRMDFFGSPRSPRVLFLTTSTGRSELNDLVSLSDDLRKAVGIGDDKSKFVAHITLARFRDVRGSSGYSKTNADSLEAIGVSRQSERSATGRGRPSFFDFDPIDIKLDRVVLYETVTTERGLRYDELASFEMPIEGR